MTATAADLAVVERWWRHCLERRDLPADLECVHRRLVRWVGRGSLPAAGDVHVKVMAFPRLKDRLRYVHRALPARHEAEVLAAVRAAGIACPDVVAARTVRSRGWPRLSMLVTRTLAVASGAPTPAAMAELAAALAAGGVFHPDLHAGNFLSLRDGRTAVIDLQSARLRRRPLRVARRAAMARRWLAAEPDLEAGVLVRAGLLPPAQEAAVVGQALALRRRGLVRRIERCLRTSTEFEARRRWNGVLHRRRGVPLAEPPVRGGRVLVRYWLGDRTREVLDSAPPVLSALFRKSWWLPGRFSVYSPVDRDAVSAQAEALLDGFERLLALRRGDPAVADDPRRRRQLPGVGAD